MKSTITTLAGLLLLMGVGSAMLSGCTDDMPQVGPADSGRNISFTARLSDDWQTGSRGASAQTIVAAVGVSRLTASGCSDLYLIGAQTEGFGLNRRHSSSRASLDDDIDQLSFGVYATLGADAAPGNYMANVAVAKSGDYWAPEREYLWPGDGTAISFMAYAPYTETPDAVEGITDLPAPTAAGEVQLSYTVPAEVADQLNLMWASPVEASASPCALVFNHALTAIRFVAGDDMQACTVKAITVAGVKNSGALNIATGAWSQTQGAATYTVEPGLTLNATNSGSTVAPQTPLIADDQVMLLLPQVLGDEATVSMTIEADGTETTYSASLAGQVWAAGTTVTYSLSASPAGPGLILKVVDSDGNVVKTLSTPYTGGTHDFTVRSYYTDGAGGTMVPVEWEAELYSASGQPLASMPSWIVSLPESGTDNESCQLVTDVPDPVFLATNAHTERLRTAADINSTSGRTRYNLSSATGADAVENTANTYIINAPGKYSLPLVYGNAVKNGSVNTAAYNSTVTHTTSHEQTTLFQLINHLGNAITDPYIYNNTGCQPASAAMVWEDQLNLVRNVRLSDDGHRIEFEVPAASIRQGNALLAVRDADDVTMWSWQLWITDVNLADNWQSVPNKAGSAVYNILNCNLGRVFGGDVTEFVPETTIVRFTQKNVPDGLTPLSIDVELNQESATITTPDCHPFYEWGRKDPMVSAVKQYYNAQHQALSAETLPQTPFGNNHKAQIVSAIKNPATFYTGMEADLAAITPFYLNLWNINNVASSSSAVSSRYVKSVYDPCPAGARVPLGNVFVALSNYTGSYDASIKGVVINLGGSYGTVTLSTLGYRALDGKWSGTEDFGVYWAAYAGTTRGKARYMNVRESGFIDTESDAVNLGLSVRPAKDS